MGHSSTSRLGLRPAVQVGARCLSFWHQQSQVWAGIIRCLQVAWGVLPLYKTQVCLGVKAPMLQRRPFPQRTLPVAPEERGRTTADLRPGGEKPQGLEEPRDLALKSRGLFPGVGVRGHVTTEGPKRWDSAAIHTPSPDCPIRDTVLKAVETSRKLALATHSQGTQAGELGRKEL